MTFSRPFSVSSGSSRPAGSSMEFSDTGSSAASTCTVIRAAEGSQTTPDAPPWFAAIECLGHRPESLAQAHERVQAFSRQRGCLSQITQKGHSTPVPDEQHPAFSGATAMAAPDVEQLTASGRFAVVRPPRRFELKDAYRYWSDPVASGSSRGGKSLPDALPVGQDGWRLGGAALSLAGRFSSLYGGSPSNDKTLARPCTARLYSRLGGFGEAGAWHAMLAELAQDLYLSELLNVLPTHEETPREVREVAWPTLSGPSLMCLEHGLGVPVMQINWQRNAVAFFDVTPESLISLEGRLFCNWLLTQVNHASATWTERQLDEVLTPALSEWVRSMRCEAVSGGTGLWASWFRFLQSQTVSSGSSRAGSYDGGGLVCMQAELGHMKQVSNEQISQATLDDWADAYPGWFATIDGLATLQDNIRYGGGNLPAAGLERAYLNSLLRNMTCNALGLHEPAEVAQFDLLLRACRSTRNNGFNDYSFSRALEQHHVWVAESQSGSRSGERKALRAFTDAFVAELGKSADDCMFALDEPSRATANRFS